MQKKAFTLIELVIGIVLIGIGLSAIISVLMYATRLTNTTKAQIVAIGLAREGIETVINIRDTNWKMFSSKRDKCWLSRIPDYTSVNCEDFTWLNSTERYYYIKSPLKNIVYFTGENLLIPNTAAGGLAVLENQGTEPNAATSGYRMCFTPAAGDVSGYRDTCTGAPSEQQQTRYGRFWRSIEIRGLFTKANVATGGAFIVCADGNGAGCGTSAAKELRFCSKVDYVFDIARRVELCTAVTNFLE